jgi:hypothetical protein
MKTLKATITGIHVHYELSTGKPKHYEVNFKSNTDPEMSYSDCLSVDKILNDEILFMFRHSAACTFGDMWVEKFGRLPQEKDFI